MYARPRAHARTHARTRAHTHTHTQSYARMCTHAHLKRAFEVVGEGGKRAAGTVTHKGLMDDAEELGKQMIA